MVAIEAAAHGLATVAYATGGVVDAVAQGISGYLVHPNDAAVFAQAVLELMDAPLPKPRVISFAKSLGWERFGQRLYKSLRAVPRV